VCVCVCMVQYIAYMVCVVRLGKIVNIFIYFSCVVHCCVSSSIV